MTDAVEYRVNNLLSWIKIYSESCLLLSITGNNNILASFVISQRFYQLLSNTKVYSSVLGGVRKNYGGASYNLQVPSKL
jgi:hypothetical protein